MREIRMCDEDDDGDDYVTESCGNLWADIGASDASEAFARSQLMRHVQDILRELKVNEAQTAELLGTSKEVVQQLTASKLGKFSIGQLFEFLEALGYDVDIGVHKRAPVKRISLRTAAVG
jgi:predicted XRE-type DNA-binding protein